MLLGKPCNKFRKRRMYITSNFTAVSHVPPKTRWTSVYSKSGILLLAGVNPDMKDNLDSWRFRACFKPFDDWMRLKLLLLCTKTFSEPCKSCLRLSHTVAPYKEGANFPNNLSVSTLRKKACTNKSTFYDHKQSYEERSQYLVVFCMRLVFSNKTAHIFSLRLKQSLIYSP